MRGIPGSMAFLGTVAFFLAAMRCIARANIVGLVRRGVFLYLLLSHPQMPVAQQAVRSGVWGFILQMHR